MMANTVRFHQDSVPKQDGERARIRIVHGPDVGVIFVLKSKKAVVGRGEDCDIPLSDASMSRRHAEIQFFKTGWKIVDLGSSNGIVHNGESCREASLKVNDKIELGETLFEFIPSADVDPQLLLAPPKSALQIQSEQKAFSQQRERIRALAGASVAARTSQKQKKKTAGLPKPLLIAGMVGVAVYVMSQSPDQQKAQPKKTVAKAPARDTAGLLVGQNTTSLSPEFEKSVDAFYKSGFREYRNGNYMRAKQQFEMALQIDPGHALSRMYLNNVIAQVKLEIDALMERGSRSYGAGKLKEAKMNYEAVLRMLSRDTSHPKYKEAKDRVDEIDQTLKGKG